MRARGGHVATLLAIAVLAFASAARADRNEWRLAPVGLVGAANVQQGSRSAWSTAAGAGVRVAYGLLDFLELGLHTGFVAAPQLEFDRVTFGGQPGDLFATAYVVELALDVRLLGDVNLSRAFARVHPFLGVRGGGLLRIATSRKLVDDQRQVISQPGTDTTGLGAITGYGGFEWRLRRMWLLGAGGSFTYGGSGYYTALANVELSWMTY